MTTVAEIETGVVDAGAETTSDRAGARAPLRYLLAVGFLVGCSPGTPPDPSQEQPVPSGTRAEVEERDFSRHFGQIEGAFVLLNPRTNRLVVHNPERARTRFPPASTFKIPNSLIALERGDHVHFFATNIAIRKNQDAAARLPVTKEILRELGLIED